MCCDKLTFISEGDDFRVADGENLVQSFLPGTTDQELCITLDNLGDMAIENSENYTVTFESTDQALLIRDNLIFIIIMDDSNGMIWLIILLQMVTHNFYFSI